MKPCAELVLYFGSCSKNPPGKTTTSLWENIFSETGFTPENVVVYNHCVGIIKDWFAGAPSFIRYERAFCMNETDAAPMIRLAESAVEGVCGIFKIQSLFHGRVTFSRRIRFPGWTEAQKDELTALLKDKGISPTVEQSVFALFEWGPDCAYKRYMFFLEYNQYPEEIEPSKSWGR